MALDREQRLSSLGALAAAAAHRLGSPLGTIAVVAKELARDLPADNPMRGDVDLLLSETERCREILTELSTRPEGSAPLDRLPIGRPGGDGGRALPYRPGQADRGGRTHVPRRRQARPTHRAAQPGIASRPR